MPCQEPPQKPAQIAQIAEKPAQKLSGVVNWVEEKLGSPRRFVWDGGGACYRLAALNLAVLNLNLWCAGEASSGGVSRPGPDQRDPCPAQVPLSGNVPFFSPYPPATFVNAVTVES